VLHAGALYRGSSNRYTARQFTLKGHTLMCFAYDALPPHPPVAGGAADSEDLLLESADGTKFLAFGARAVQPNGAGIVVLPDVRGIFPFYEELALRFAEQGVNACTIDYFGRTAGTDERPEDFAFMEHVAKTKPDQIAADVAAGVAWLRSPAGGSCTSIFTVGFCFGGSNSWNQAANGHGLKGVIGFYGHPTRSMGEAPAVIDRVAQFECPVVALMGGADPMITADVVGQFKDAMDAHGIENEVKIYEGAPHSFFDRSFEEHKEACDDAWMRMIAFIGAKKD
jgi:carboxymethylenebutenolidase